MFLKLLLHVGKIFITRRIITRDGENDPRIYQQTSFSIPAKISLRSTKNDRTNETTRIPSPPTRPNRFLYRFFRFEAGSRGTSFSCRSRFPIRTEWIGRAENKRLPWSSCLSSLLVVSPLSWLERRNSKEGKGRSSDWQGAEGKTRRKDGKRNEERRRRSGIFQPEFLDVVIPSRERERERGSRRKTFNSRDVYFRRTWPSSCTGCASKIAFNLGCRPISTCFLFAQDHLSSLPHGFWP